MNRRFLSVLLVASVVMFFSCSGDNGPTGPTEVSYSMSDLVGTWAGEAENSSNTVSPELTCASEGEVSGTGVSSTWSVDSDGKVTGGGTYSFQDHTSLLLLHDGRFSLVLNSQVSL